MLVKSHPVQSNIFKPCRLDTVDRLGELGVAEVQKLDDEVALLDQEILLDRLEVTDEVAVLHQQLKKSCRGECVSGRNNALYKFEFDIFIQEQCFLPDNVQDSTSKRVV